jgi:hypothetical protein
MFTTGCSLFNQEDNRKPSERVQQPDNEQQKGNQNNNQQSDDKGSSDDNIGDSGETSKYSFLNKEQLSKGIFKGLNVETGLTMEQANERFGEPIETDYLQGGKYNLYELDDYKLLLFDVDEGYVKHVILYPKFDLKLKAIRDVLGQPEYEGLSDLYGNWSLVYYYGNYSFFIDGQTEDSNGNVSRFFLKEEY